MVNLIIDFFFFLMAVPIVIHYRFIKSTNSLLCIKYRALILYIFFLILKSNLLTSFSIVYNAQKIRDYELLHLRIINVVVT